MELSKASEPHKAFKSPDTPSKPPLPTSCPTCKDIHIIGYKRVPLGQDDDVPTLARNTLNTAIDAAILDQTGEPTAFGNPLGLQLLEERDSLGSRLDRMEAQLVAQNEEIAANKKEIGAHKEKFSELEGRIAAQEEEAEHLKLENVILQEGWSQYARRVQFLCQHSKEYIQSRHDFLDSYKERMGGLN